MALKRLKNRWVNLEGRQILYHSSALFYVIMSLFLKVNLLIILK